MKYLIFLVSIILLTSCSKIENEFKNLNFPQCPDKSIHQVLSNNFDNQKWQSFKKNGKEFVRFDGVNKFGEKKNGNFCV